MRGFFAGARVERQFLTAYPDSVIPFMTAPLFTVIFMLVFRQAGRPDLVSYAAVAPTLIALWWLTLANSGWTITVERWNGTLELLVAAPSSFAAVVLGRIATTTMIGTFSFLESWLVARVAFGDAVVVYHPLLFAVTALVTLPAMAGTAVAIAACFVLARNATTWSNSASYPFLLLAGVLVPVRYLPAPVRPLGGAVFLSWSAGLLRDVLAPQPVANEPARLGAIAALGAGGFLAGAALLRVVLRRVREAGDLSSA